MANVTGLTAARMLEIEAACIVDGDVVGDNLILRKHDNSTIDAGDVRGPTALESGPIATRPAPETFTKPTLWAASDDADGSLSYTDGEGSAWAYAGARVLDLGRRPAGSADNTSNFVITQRGAWTNPATYIVGDWVTDPGDSNNTYINILGTNANTQPHLDGTHWRRQALGVPITELSQTITVAAGETLHFEGIFYVSSANGAAQTSRPVTVALTEDGTVINSAAIPNITTGAVQTGSAGIAALSCDRAPAVGSHVYLPILLPSAVSTITHQLWQAGFEGMGIAHSSFGVTR